MSGSGTGTPATSASGLTVSDVVEAAMRKLAITASGETPTDAELADGLTALQSMLRSWAAEKIIVFASTKESFTLTSGTYLYTWGDGGTINTVRPHQVLGAYILDSGGVTHLVDIISEDKYRRITVKATIGRPYVLFFHPTYPTVNLYLYPVPNTAEVMYLDSIKPFTETSSFDGLTSVLALPVNYEEPIIYNLAIRLAPEFGKKLTAEVVGIAANSHNRLVTLNAANQVAPVSVSIPAGSSHGARYSINSDSYH